MSRSVSLALMLLAAPVAAQEKLPDLGDILGQVQDSEIYLQGLIGTAPDGAVQFVLPEAPGTAYDVAFESGEDMVKRLEGCNWPGAPCLTAAYGSVRWNGPKLAVVIYSFETLAVPPSGN